MWGGGGHTEQTRQRHTPGWMKCEEERFYVGRNYSSVFHSFFFVHFWSTLGGEKIIIKPNTSFEYSLTRFVSVIKRYYYHGAVPYVLI